MWKWIRFPLLFLLAMILQTTLAKWLRFFDWGPDFIVIFVVLIAFRRGPIVGALWGFFAGFTLDVYAPVEWLGANTIAYLCLGYAVGLLEARFLSLNITMRVVILGLGFFLVDFIYFFIVSTPKQFSFLSFLSTSLPECLYTMFIGALVFKLLFKGSLQNKR